ncbi:MAG: tRNA lysidine(34) synthetase TilS [Gammaproteobacteria bacterium]|nr:tRNA lysidine(34) synthetase TilS [Gammaproteobacteria bacterium]
MSVSAGHNKPPSSAHPLQQRLFAALQACWSPSAADRQPPAVVVAYSSGADSTALLHAASCLHDLLRLRLRALHINHGLHPDCDRWQQLAMQQCAALKLPLTVIQVEVDSTAASLENTAREARYAAFCTQLQADEILLLAHHQRDQAETVLLHLLRGSGAAGLAGMPQSRPLGDRGAMLLRPWLHCSARQLRDYCREHNLKFSEDSSNLDPRHDRGWLRSELLPLLEQRKPGAIANIALSARLLEHTRRLAAAQLDQLLQTLLPATGSATADNSLDIAGLLQHEPLLQHDLLRNWLRSLRLQPPPRQQLQTLLEQLSTAAADRHPSLLQPDYVLQADRQRLHVHARSQPVAKGLSWQTPQALQHAQFGQLQLLDAAPNRAARQFETAITTGLTNWPRLQVTARIGGERIRLRDGHHHRVKSLLQQANIPVWQRARLPLIWHRNRLIAVADLFLHPALHRWLQRRGLQLQWTPAAALPRHQPDKRNHHEQASKL